MITFIFGGIRSGKSKFANSLAEKYSNVSYIATSIFYDDEMKKRIEIHRKMRPDSWKVIEEGKDLTGVLKNLSCELCIIDCFGMFVSNLLIDNLSDFDIEIKIKEFAQQIKEAKFNCIIVSNDVGGSVVSENELARRFVDLIGFGNQILASISDNVFLMNAGIPQAIKSFIP
ncbi:MAG: bifunctional adenosylcobinamide kinase/adenosylcobinamide-phosphate guanylyltransferase [bacterium]